MRNTFVAGLALLLGCGSHQPPPPPTDPAALMHTLEALAGFGQKRVGTPGGQQAGEYVSSRMTMAGLQDVHYESFQFPRYDVQSGTLTVTIAGTQAPMGFDVFEASAAGHVTGNAVYVHSATDSDLAGVDLTGKVALVDRNSFYHRSTQLANVVGRGALAMLYVSAAQDNLRQVGSVRRGWESMVPAPAITIGKNDGDVIKNALAASKPVTVAVDVQAQSVPATGRNVIGRIPGRDARGQILIGAHYDTWFTGSSDNGSGIAELLALAARRVQKDRPRYTLVFVAYDGEEVALYGGYDYLRKHRVLTADPILAVLNFEMPSARDTTTFGLARSNVPLLDEALVASGLSMLYSLYVSLDLVPQLFGGIIPTDIQGIYRAGVPTVSTAVDSPYYHTTADTPDKVDTDVLAKSVDEFDATLDKLLAQEPSGFEVLDPKLWRGQATLHPRTAADPVVVDVTITDAMGTPQANAPVNATLLVDDFFSAATSSGTTDGAGKGTLSFPANAAQQGSGHRFVHLGAGPMYPLVEIIVAIP
jgi:aminopeptidase YwaD